MNIRLFNTMSRKMEDFQPLTPGHVGFYSCGPTVYHYTHIGNLRSFVLADLLKRMFLENGYKVFNVMNITDVGHLTSDDDDSGEDKMEKGAARENKSVWDVAKFYTDEFLRDSADLNLLEPSARPRATEYIQQQIDLVQKLVDLGYTYEIPGDGIYYDTSKFAAYGALTGGALGGNRAGARVEFNDAKRNPTDFALWKFSPTDKKRQMEWASPWGVGFPGWHIECSAMSMALLGAHFDIHTGGVDLSRVHHANEIAQSEPITGTPWVKYWVHSEFLVDKSGEKMSKSSGEFLTLSVLKNRGYDPMAYRYMLLMGHYQSQLAFSWEGLDAASNGYKNLVRRVADIIDAKASNAIDSAVFDEWHDKILGAVSDNLKTAEALVAVQELLKSPSVDADTKYALVEFIDRLLGLRLIPSAQKLKELETADVPADILALADARAEAKAARDWARADELRTQIDAAGWSVVDTKDGAKIIKRHNLFLKSGLFYAILPPAIRGISMNYPYMPKSTALWLIENTALTFEQIADFCGMHELEVKNIADAETCKVQGLNPILNGQVTREDIEKCEADPNARLTLREEIVVAQKAQNKKGVGYTPKLHRQNRLGGILWIVKNYPELSDGQIARLMRSTNPTVASVRNKTHKSYSLIQIQSPIVLGLVSESALHEAVAKAKK